MRNKLSTSAQNDPKNVSKLSQHGANNFQKEKMQMTKYIVEDMPAYLDIRFGNLCNLKCRMCGSWASNQWF